MLVLVFRCPSASGVVEHVLELHHRSQHIVREVTVGQDTFQLPELLQPTGREVSSSSSPLSIPGSME